VVLLYTFSLEPYGNSTLMVCSRKRQNISLPRFNDTVNRCEMSFIIIFLFSRKTILRVILQSPRFFLLLGDDFSTDPPKQIETRSALVKRGGNRANGNYTTIIGDTVGLWSTENDGGGDQGHEISIILHTRAHTSTKVYIVTRAPFIYWIPTTTGAKYNNNK